MNTWIQWDLAWFSYPTVFLWVWKWEITKKYHLNEKSCEPWDFGASYWQTTPTNAECRWTGGFAGENCDDVSYSCNLGVYRYTGIYLIAPKMAARMSNGILQLDLQCRNDHLSHLVHLVWLWWLAEELCQQVPSGHVLVVRPGPGPPNQQVLRWVHNEALQPSSLWSSRRSGAQRQGPPSANFQLAVWVVWFIQDFPMPG